ncbi:Flavin monooxygenase-like protein [Niveomyces insectorum RCEF 264]|uniref:Flavin monooxygenase-like protein n=1 Tax=Niveomyces insectorum RCEF 264 TaxID=1081102 RepID=A0A167ME71_9HYPO|nr:Flavin monooxygenase-like protein [Niveomyces insectorum RCEF 264]
MTTSTETNGTAAAAAATSVNGSNGSNGTQVTKVTGGTPGYVPPPRPTPSPVSPAVSALFPDNKSDIVAATYAHEPRRVRAIVIGAGLSAVAFAYKARLVEQFDYTFYERDADVGGVWLKHTYPGISCDVPAHGYSYTFRPNPNWSRFYAGGDEICRWLQTQAHDYELYAHARFQHEVRRAVWHEDRSVWAVEVQDLQTGRVFTDEAEVFINGSGFLSHWKWPDIPGLHAFQGTLLHTAKWDYDTANLKDKRVAVIGNGASGIQLVPNIYPLVKSLVAFNRSPTWIAPEFGFVMAKDGRDTVYTEEQRRAFREHPETLLQHRREVEHIMNLRFPSFYKNSEAQRQTQAFIRDSMVKRLQAKPALAAKLIPPFQVGCRRVTPGNGYLEALAQPNADVVTAGIREVVPQGLVDNEGTLHEVDVICCATGYDTTFVPRIPIVGRGGVNMQDKWRAEGAAAYLSVAVPGFPNYFALLGPNSPISNGSLVGALEHQIDYALKFVRKLQTERVASFAVTEAAAAEFREWKDAMMQGLAFSGSCTSWYKGGTADGPVVGPWPGSVNHFMEIIKEPRYEDYAFTYPGRNRFTYFGDGRSPKEAKGEPLGWYMQ